MIGEVHLSHLFTKVTKICLPRVSLGQGYKVLLKDGGIMVTCKRAEMFSMSYNKRIFVFNKDKLKEWAKANFYILPERAKKYIEISE